MHVIYGVLMAVAGLFIVVSATLRREFIIYRLMVARSRVLWGDRVHLFHQVSGVVVLVLGLLWAFGVIWVEG